MKKDSFYQTSATLSCQYIFFHYCYHLKKEYFKRENVFKQKSMSSKLCRHQMQRIHNFLNTPPQICSLCRICLSSHCACVVIFCLGKHGLGKGENMTSKIYFHCHKANTSRERLRKLEHADIIMQQHHQQYICRSLLIKTNFTRSL